MMWLREGDTPLMWAAELAGEVIHSKDETAERTMSADELKELAHYLLLRAAHMEKRTIGWEFVEGGDHE